MILISSMKPLNGKGYELFNDIPMFILLKALNSEYPDPTVVVDPG